MIMMIMLPALWYRT